MPDVTRSMAEQIRDALEPPTYAELKAERDRLREFAERVVEVYGPAATLNPGGQTYWMRQAALEALGRG